jgi:hypothetical protein
MTFPCVDVNHFDPNGGAPTPQEWLQLRHVSTAFAAGVDNADVPLSGSLPNILIHTLQASWLNNTPIPQQCYGLITRGGSEYSLQAPLAWTMNQSHGTVVGVAPADPALTLVSKFGGWIDAGIFIPSGLPVYMVMEDRIGPRTALIGGTVTVNPGETYKAKAEVRMVATVWSNTGPDGGTSENERRFMSGDTRIDLFSYPILP